MIRSSVSKHKALLIRKLVKSADRMIQGGLSQTTRTCGTPSCRCHVDPKRRHGPHAYLTFRTAEGKNGGFYVSPKHLEEVVEAKKAWDQFWEAATALATLNREQMKEGWRSDAKGKVKK